MAKEHRKEIEGQIDQLAREASDRCDCCKNNVPAIWSLGQRIHARWDDAKWEWVHMCDCEAEFQHKEIDELRRKLK